MATSSKKIVSDIIKKREQALKSAGASVNKTVKEIARIAYSDIADYLQIDNAGSVKPIALDAMKPGSTRAIKKIREKRRILNGKEDDTILEDTFEFELHDKIAGLNLLVALQEIKPAEKVDVQAEGIEAILERVYAKRGGNRG